MLGLRSSRGVCCSQVQSAVGSRPTPQAAIIFSFADPRSFFFHVHDVDTFWRTQEPVAEEEDDDQDSVEPAGSLLGCYQDSDVNPILTFLYEDENDLTPAVRADKTSGGCPDGKRGSEIDALG